MFFQLSIYLSVLLFSILIFSILGKFLLALFGINGHKSNYVNFAMSQIIGICISTIFTAVYFTHCRTVLLLILIIFFFVWIELYKEKQVSFSIGFITRFKSHFKNISYASVLEFTLFFILIFVWQANTFIDFKTGSPIECNADLHSLFMACNDMASSGIERFVVYDLPSNIHSYNAPYHYFEYWFTIMFSKLTYGLPIYNLKLHTIPVFIIILYSLFCIMAESINIKLNFFIKFCAITIVFFCPPANFIWDNAILGSNIALEPLLYKSIHLYWIVILIFIALIQNKYNLAIISLLSYSVVCYTAMPIIFPTIIILLIISYLFNRYIILKSQNYKINNDFLLPLIYTCIILFFLWAFYKVTMMAGTMSELFPYSFHNDYTLNKAIAHFHKSEIRGFVNHLFPISGLCILMIATYLLKINVLNKKAANYGPYIITIVLSQFLFSAALSVFFYYSYDAFVLYRITNIPFINITILLISLLWYADYFNYGNIKYLLLGLSCFFIVKNALSSFDFDKNRKIYLFKKEEVSYRKKTINFIKSINSVGVFMKSEDTITENSYNYGKEYDMGYTNTSYQQRCVHTIYHLGMFLDYYKPNVLMHPITLTPPSNFNDNSLNQEINKCYFYSIFCLRVLKDTTLPEDQKRIEFIKYTNASFLMASKYAKIGAPIYNLFTDSAINPVNGERFYLLKKNIN